MLRATHPCLQRRESPNEEKFDAADHLIVTRTPAAQTQTRTATATATATATQTEISDNYATGGLYFQDDWMPC